MELIAESDSFAKEEAAAVSRSPEEDVVGV
jgi:hypothetical protein